MPAPQHILCPNCNVAVKEYHRHCPYCGHDLRRKTCCETQEIRCMAGDAWQAWRWACWSSVWTVYNGVYFEREIPVRFLIGFIARHAAGVPAGKRRPLPATQAKRLRETPGLF